MNHLCRTGLFLVFIHLFPISSFAQKSYSFGKVSSAEIDMKVYPNDTTAGAIVLCDIGKFTSNNSFFYRHLRIKILKKSGLDQGNRIFNTSSKANFNVTVYNRINGEIVKEKAKSSSIYTEQVIDDFMVYKVFAPNVIVGSVIDIEYSFIGMPGEWRFQETIPVIYSSLSLEPSQFISYTKSATGFEKIDIISPYEWKAENVPAFKVEPFVNHYSNYITKFDFHLQSISIPGRFFFDYGTSWRKVVDHLLENSQFGDIETKMGYLNDFAKDLKNKDTSLKEKINEAYEYVQKNIKWSKQKSMYVSEEFRSHFQTDHIGNSAEINLTLVYLLKKAGIKAYPVVLSTRDNGLVLQHTPSLNNLNYVVGFVQQDDLEMVLDATSEDLVPGIVPSYCLNGYGLLIKKDNEQWIDLQRKNAFVKKQYITINLNPDDRSTAKINHDYIGYGFTEWYSSFHEINFDIDEMKNNLKKDFPNTKILNYEVPLKDKSTQKGKDLVELDISEQIISTSNEIIFNPFLLLDYSKNPFIAEERRCPVDLNYPQEFNSTILVQLPEGYIPNKLPSSIKLTSPDGTASFIFLSNHTGSVIQFKAILKFTNSIYSEVDYKDLRKLYGEVSKLVTTPIELTKSSIK